MSDSSSNVLFGCHQKHISVGMSGIYSVYPDIVQHILAIYLFVPFLIFLTFFTVHIQLPKHDTHFCRKAINMLFFLITHIPLLHQHNEEILGDSKQLVEVILYAVNTTYIVLSNMQGACHFCLTFEFQQKIYHNIIRF